MIPLEIIKDGASNYIVALNTGTSESEQYAAQKLVHYIEKSTGVNLVIKQGLSEIDTDENMIVLGYGDISENLDFSYFRIGGCNYSGLTIGPQVL